MRQKTEIGYSIQQLAAAAGTSVRTIHFWVRRGAIAKPPFRGRATRYPPVALARIHVLRELQREGLDLREIRRRLDNATVEELEAWAARATAPRAAPTASTMAATPPAALPEHAQRWQRVTLLPGLELHLLEGSGPLLAGIAQEIAQRYSGPK